MAKDCPSCGFSNRDTAKFCAECAHKLPSTCPHCGEKAPEKGRFCDQCGKPIETPMGKALEQEVKPEQVPDIIKKKISRVEHIAGERRVISAMFADVAGFTALSKIVGAEEISNLMNRCFEIMAKEIYRMDGMINKYLGDGLMALFGAPIAHEDHAIRAVLSGLNIQKTMTALSDETQQKWGREFRLRIGINTGEVVTGNIGNDYQMEYTAMGDTINLASRIEGQAEPGTVAVSEHTRNRVRHFFNMDPMGERQLKGIQEPVMLYKVLRQQKRKSAIDLAAPAMLSSFTGREMELETLKELVDLAEQGEGRITIIQAEPGLGKSRLLYELKQTLAQRDVSYLEGRCISYGQNSALLPIIDMTKEFFGIEDEYTPGTVREKLKEGLGEIGLAAENIIPYLMNLYSVVVEGGALEGQDEESIRRRTLEILKDMVFQGSRDRLLVITIEDLHWMDNSTEAFLTFLVSSIENRKVFILCTTRPSYKIKWSSLPNFSLIDLKPLDDENSRSLVLQALGEKAVSPDMEALILNKAHGNPLFIEELANVLESGVNGEEATIPETIQDIIMSRLDRLNDDARQTALLASVIGRDFSFELLGRVRENAESVKASLDELVARLLIYEKTAMPDMEYTFKHSLIQEVAYRSMLDREKKKYHLRIARIMEEMHESRLEEKCEDIAFHYMSSDDSEKAIKYLVMAGDKMRGVSANREAEAYYHRAVQVIKLLPESEENNRKYIDASILRIRAMYSFVNADEILNSSKELEKAAADINHEEGLARIYGLSGSILTVKGKHVEALAMLEKCRDIFQKKGMLDDYARTSYNIGFTKFNMGDPVGSLEHFSESARVYEECGNLHEISPPLQMLSIIYCWRGDKEKACSFSDRSMEIIEKIGSKPSMAYHARGIILSAYADSEAAIDCYEKGFKMAKETGNLHGALFNIGTMVGHYINLDQLDKAIEKGEEAVALSEEMGVQMMMHVFYGDIGTAYMLAGNVDKAREFLQKTKDLIKKVQNPFKNMGTGSFGIFMNIMESGGLNDAIDADIKRLKTKLKELEYFAIEPGIDLHIAETCLRVGDIDGFKKHIDPAITNSHKFKMNWLLERARKLKKKVLCEEK